MRHLANLQVVKATQMATQNYSALWLVMRVTRLLTIVAARLAAAALDKPGRHDFALLHQIDRCADDFATISFSCSQGDIDALKTSNVFQDFVTSAFPEFVEESMRTAATVLPEMPATQQVQPLIFNVIHSTAEMVRGVSWAHLTSPRLNSAMRVFNAWIPHMHATQFGSTTNFKLASV